MLSEFELIRRFFDRPARNAVLGVGDDAALLQLGAGMELVVSSDMLIETRHFGRGADPRKLGHKALAVNLSDMAAMGAAPRWALLGISLPAPEEAWLAGFAAGLYGLADRYGVSLVGGDTTRAPAEGPVSICITILGEVPAGQALRRDGARPGDDIWVSGELGGAALALAHPEIAGAAKRLHEPEPRIELGQRLRGLASAAIDLSDGFAQDLGHILERSAVGAIVHYDLLPKSSDLTTMDDRKNETRCVLSGGDDYELAFTAPQSARPGLAALSPEFKLSLVGSVRAGESTLVVMDSRGKPMTVARGFDHFAA